MAEIQYQNMRKGCKGILPQGESLQNLQVTKGTVVSIYKTDKLILSKNSLKKVPEKG